MVADESTDAPHNGETLAVVVRHLDAFNKRNVDELCAGFSENIVFSTGEDILSGREVLRRFFQDALDGSVQLALALRRAIVDEDVVACELVESVTIQGVTQEQSIAAFYTVRNGLLTSVKVYREGTADIQDTKG